MKRILSILPVFLFLFSCESLVEDFEIKKPEDKITLIGDAYAGNFSAFYLTSNLSLMDPAFFPPITVAHVEVFWEEEKIGDMILNDTGWYSANSVDFLPGNSYMIRSSATGFPDVTAEFEIPTMPEVTVTDTNLIIESYPDCPECGNIYQLEYILNFKNTSDIDEFYYIEVLPSNSTGNESINTAFSIISNAPYIETISNYGDNYSNRIAGEEAMGLGFYFSDKRLVSGFNTLIFRVELNNFYGPIGDYGLKIIFRKVDKNMFEYVQSKGRSSGSDGNPFVQPVTIFSNVENGLGLVSGSSGIEIITDISEIIFMMNL